MRKVDEMASKAANAVALSKLKAIAQRLQNNGKEPSVGEARFAATFVDTIRTETIIRWLEELAGNMECDADSEKIKLFIANLRGDR